MENLNSLFEKNSDQFLIKKFQALNAKDLEKISTPENDTLLDLAIAHRKDGFLQVLLEKDFNPFLYSHKTSESIETEDKIKNLIYSYQRPYLNILIQAGISPAFQEEFEKNLRELKIRSSGCKVLLETILDGYLYHKTSRDSEVIKYIEDDQILASMQGILNSKSCNGIKELISSAEIKKWFADEWLLQANQNFKSIDLLSLLKDMGPIENLHIDGLQDGKKIKIDPRLLIFLGRIPTNSDGLKLKENLLNFVNKHISRSLHYYNLQYIQQNDITYISDSLLECDFNKDPLCEKSAINLENIRAAGTALSMDISHIKNPEANDDSEGL